MKIEFLLKDLEYKIPTDNVYKKIAKILRQEVSKYVVDNNIKEEIKYEIIFDKTIVTYLSILFNCKNDFSVKLIKQVFAL